MDNMDRVVSRWPVIPGLNSGQPMLDMLSMSTLDFPCQSHSTIALYQHIPDAVSCYHFTAYLKRILPI